MTEAEDEDAGGCAVLFDHQFWTLSHGASCMHCSVRRSNDERRGYIDEYIATPWEYNNFNNQHLNCRQFTSVFDASNTTWQCSCVYIGKIRSYTIVCILYLLLLLVVLSSSLLNVLVTFLNLPFGGRAVTCDLWPVICRSMRIVESNLIVCCLHANYIMVLLRVKLIT